jgi:RHS repeat-associated protein
MGLLVVNDGNASALYHADGNGNITCLIQTNGTVVARYSYDPFGGLLTQNGSLAEANAYRFSSKEWHANAGLYYYGYRFYSPELQRWPNRDPIGEAGFEAVRGERANLRRGEPNRYLFVYNDPVRTMDLWGLDAGSGLGNFDGKPLCPPTPCPGGNPKIPL